MSKRSCAFNGSYVEPPCSDLVDPEELDPSWKQQGKTPKQPKKRKAVSVPCEEDAETREKKRVDALFKAFSDRYRRSGEPFKYLATEDPWSKISVAIATPEPFGIVKDSPEVRNILVLCEQRGLLPFRLTGAVLGSWHTSCKSKDPSSHCHPTRIIWVGEKSATPHVKWRIGEGHPIKLEITDREVTICKGLNFDTVIFHKDAEPFLRKNDPEGFLACKWVCDEEAELQYQRITDCGIMTEEIERLLSHKAEYLCKGTERKTRWIFNGQVKLKPLKDPEDFVCQFGRIFREPVALEVSEKKDGWGIIVEVWKERGEDLSFHFESMGVVQKTVGVETGVGSMMDHLKHVLRSEHLVAPPGEDEEPIWRNGLHVRAKFELIATPACGGHEVGHSSLARIVDIHRKAHVQKELCRLAHATLPDFDGMPRLLLCPLYVEFVGFCGKQVSMENYEGTCFWGANQTIETHAQLLQMFFPAKLGSDSPIQHVDRQTIPFCISDHRETYEEWLKTARKNKKEGVVLAVCAKDIEYLHPNLSYGIFESQGDEPFRRIRTHCKAKTYVSLNLTVEVGKWDGVPTFVFKDSKGRFVYELGQDEYKHILPELSKELAKVKGKTVIPIKASAINKRDGADKRGRIYVLQSVYYIRKRHCGTLVADDIAEVFKDPMKNGHHLACIEATRQCDEWINRPSTHKWAKDPLAKQMKFLEEWKRDAAKQVRK